MVNSTVQVTYLTYCRC